MWKAHNRLSSFILCFACMGMWEAQPDLPDSRRHVLTDDQTSSCSLRPLSVSASKEREHRQSCLLLASLAETKHGHVARRGVRRANMWFLVLMTVPTGCSHLSNSLESASGLEKDTNLRVAVCSWSAISTPKHALSQGVWVVDMLALHCKFPYHNTWNELHPLTN